MADNSDYYKIYKDIKKRVKQRYDMRKEFFSHLAAYLIFLVMTYIVFGPQTGIWDGINLLTAAWTIGIVVHAVIAYFEERTEVAIDREMMRMGIYNTEEEKPKRDDVTMRLSDDGELVEAPFADKMDDDEIQQHA
jgi:hypothetical protein